MNKMKLRGVIAAVSGAMLLSFGVNAMADTTDDIVNALMAKGVLTEEEGALLMKGRTGEKEAAEAKKKTAVTAKYKDGIVFESGDGDFSATLNGRVHADYRYFGNESSTPTLTESVTNSIANATNVPDTFELRRARIGMKAKFKKYYEAEVVGDFTSAGATIDVAYLNVAWWKEAQFRFGIFKMPMNLEELTSSNNIDFMERSFVNQLAPTKEIGLMLHGTPYKGITYALAGSNGNLKNAETDMREDGKDILGRVTANFAEILDQKDMVLHAGLSFSQGDLPQGVVGVNGRTEGRGVTFFSAPTLNDTTKFRSMDRSRYGAEGVVAYGPFKLQGEWMRANNSFSTNTRNYSLDMDNWYAEALWTITGEKYADIYKNGAFGGIKPKNDFNPTNFSGGAWEVGFRFSQFDASDYNAVGVGEGVGSDDTSFKTTATGTPSANARGFAKADSYTVGIKFLPTSNMRFMLNYVKSEFSDAIGGATGGVVLNNKRINSEDALIMRAQWMF
ncbi:MAG: hypothetical protein HOP04_06100 [Methylophilaceae bacterium]|nr:hypothetical protein [Methylophilaceae bacterium]